MEAMGFKDRGSFSKQIGGVQEESSEEEDEFVPNLGRTKRRDLKRENKQFTIFKKDTFGLGYVAT